MNVEDRIKLEYNKRLIVHERKVRIQQVAEWSAIQRKIEATDKRIQVCQGIVNTLKR